MLNPHHSAGRSLPTTWIVPANTGSTMLRLSFQFIAATPRLSGPTAGPRRMLCGQSREPRPPDSEVTVSPRNLGPGAGPSMSNGSTTMRSLVRLAYRGSAEAVTHIRGPPAPLQRGSFNLMDAATTCESTANRWKKIGDLPNPLHDIQVGLARCPSRGFHRVPLAGPVLEPTPPLGRVRAVTLMIDDHIRVAVKRDA
jgi:hypothetical protein